MIPTQNTGTLALSLCDPSFSVRNLVFVLVTGPFSENFEIGFRIQFLWTCHSKSILIGSTRILLYNFTSASLLVFFLSQTFHYNLNSNKNSVKIKTKY